MYTAQSIRFLDYQIPCSGHLVRDVLVNDLGCEALPVLVCDFEDTPIATLTNDTVGLVHVAPVRIRDGGMVLPVVSPTPSISATPEAIALEGDLRFLWG